MTGPSPIPTSYVDDEGVEWIVITAPTHDVAPYVEGAEERAREGIPGLLGYWITVAYYAAHPDQGPHLRSRRAPRSRDWRRP